MLRIFLGLILFWAILRFMKAITRVFVVRAGRPQGEGLSRGRKSRENPSLKADDVIDVDYTETPSPESTKERE